MALPGPFTPLILISLELELLSETPLTLIDLLASTVVLSIPQLSSTKQLFTPLPSSVTQFKSDPYQADSKQLYPDQSSSSLANFWSTTHSWT
jgi:hypothetical protein